MQEETRIPHRILRRKLRFPNYLITYQVIILLLVLLLLIF